MKTWTARYVRGGVWYCLLRFAVLPNFVDVASEWTYFMLLSAIILCEVAGDFFGALSDYLLGATR
jgi:hypothetical protein